MTTISVSPKFQIVIPREVRNKLALRPKQKIVVIEKGGIIHLIPDAPLKTMQGIFKGRISKAGLREKRDRL